MENLTLTYRLLEHPFYQSWNQGTITKEQLSKYGSSYLEFITKMPEYWQRALSDLSVRDDEGQRVVADERRHIDLWKRWIEILPKPEGFDSMKDLLNSFEEMKGSELLGALHAFEIQQPEVAVTKKDGLLKFYGLIEDDLTYFNEHMEEEHHLKYAEKIQLQNGNKEEFELGFARGQKLVYEALNAFM